MSEPSSSPVPTAHTSPAATASTGARPAAPPRRRLPWRRALEEERGRGCGRAPAVDELRGGDSRHAAHEAQQRGGREPRAA